MSELPIPQEAVEAAAKALGETAAYPHIVRAERALREGLKAMGTEAKREPDMGQQPVHYYLCTRWLPVEQDKPCNAHDWTYKSDPAGEYRECRICKITENETLK